MTSRNITLLILCVALPLLAWRSKNGKLRYKDIALFNYTSRGGCTRGEIRSRYATASGNGMFMKQDTAAFNKAMEHGRAGRSGIMKLGANDRFFFCAATDEQDQQHHIVIDIEYIATTNDTNYMALIIDLTNKADIRISDTGDVRYFRKLLSLPLATTTFPPR
jgi:hypothetical protein